MRRYNKSAQGYIFMVTRMLKTDSSYLLTSSIWNGNLKVSNLFLIVYVCEKNDRIMHIGLSVRNDRLQNNFESTTGWSYKNDLLCSVAKLSLLIRHTQFYYMPTEQFVTKEVIKLQITCCGKSNNSKLSLNALTLNLEHFSMK